MSRLVIGFLVIEFVSIGFSSQFGHSFARFTLSLTNWYAVFFVGCYAFSRPGAAARWAYLIWGCAVVLCFIAIWEARLGRPPWAGHIPSFLRVDDPAVQRTLAGSTRNGLVARRVAATTAHPLNLAEFLGLCVPFAVHFMMQKYPLWFRAAAALSLPLIAYAIMLTDSRLGVGAELLSIVIYFFMFAALRWNRVRSSIFAPALVLMYPIIFALFVVATFAIGRLRAEVWGGGQTQSSTQARWDQWAAGMPKIFSHPWGHGIGRGGEVLGFANGAGTLTIDTYYLNLLLEYGFLGFAVFMGLFIRAIWVAGRAGISSRASGELLLLIPISIALVNFIIIRAVLATESNFPLMFMMLSAVLALTARVRAAEDAAPAEPRAVKTASRRGVRTAAAARLSRR
jgi:O-antigen ligase